MGAELDSLLTPVADVFRGTRIVGDTPDCWRSRPTTLTTFHGVCVVTGHFRGVYEAEPGRVQLDSDVYADVFTQTIDLIGADLSTTQVILFDLPGDGSPSYPEGYSNDNMRVDGFPATINFVSVPILRALELDFYLERIGLPVGRTIARSSFYFHNNFPSTWTFDGRKEQWNTQVRGELVARLRSWASEGFVSSGFYDDRDLASGLVPAGWIHGASLGVAGWQ